MTLQELETARYEALVVLAGAVRAYEAAHEAGYEDSTHEMAGWLEKLEATYTALHGRWTALLDSGMDIEAT